MPELPDVEVYRRYLDSTSLHKTLEGVRVPSPEILSGTSPQGLGRRLKGRRFEKTRRHGKYLFAILEDGTSLVLHFGMTGELRYAKRDGAPPRHTACLFRFSNGDRLAYVAPRKLGLIATAGSVEAFIAQHELGPDALALDRQAFRDLARGRRGSLKSWLMNQAVIAGIGNVYSDEILFQARMHPRQPVDELDPHELDAIREALETVLDEAIAAGADPERMPRFFLLPHRHGSGCCPRCGGEVRRIEVSGRSSFYCPRCQRLT